MGVTLPLSLIVRVLVKLPFPSKFQRPRAAKGVPAGTAVSPCENPYPPSKLAFEQSLFFSACSAGTAPTTNVLAKTTSEMMVHFMTILLAWLLLIEMLFDALR